MVPWYERGCRVVAVLLAALLFERRRSSGFFVLFVGCWFGLAFFVGMFLLWRGHLL